MLKNSIVGESIFSILSEALYSNPIRIYREYIQNSMDSINEAYKLIKRRYNIKIDVLDTDFNIISRDFDRSKKYNIVFADDGLGLNENFASTLKSIADSQKSPESGTIGFMGIGRLSAYQYCDAIHFVNIIEDSEDTISIKCKELKDDIKSRKNQNFNMDDYFIKSFNKYDLLKGHYNKFSFCVVLENVNWRLLRKIANSGYEIQFNEMILSHNNLENAYDPEVINFYNRINDSIYFDLTINGNKLSKTRVFSKEEDIHITNFILKNDSVNKTLTTNKIGICYPLTATTRKKIGEPGIRIYYKNILVSKDEEILEKLLSYKEIQVSKTELVAAIMCFSIDIFLEHQSGVVLNSSRTWFSPDDEDVSYNFIMDELYQLIINLKDSRYAYSNLKEQNDDVGEQFVNSIKRISSNVERTEAEIEEAINQRVKDVFADMLNKLYGKDRKYTKSVFKRQPDVKIFVKSISEKLYSEYKNREDFEFSEDYLTNLLLEILQKKL